MGPDHSGDGHLDATGDKKSMAGIGVIFVQPWLKTSMQSQGRQGPEREKGNGTEGNGTEEHGQKCLPIQSMGQ